MIIKSLSLNNIRAYAGNAKIEFATDPYKNVTLIHGVNGAGKTSLFMALNWALFGDQFTFAGHLLNETLLRNAAGKSLASGEAAISFEQEGLDYYLQRGRNGNVKPDGSIYEKESGLELFYIDKRGNSKEERFAQSFIDRLLPAAIRTFFFFDGDRISDFTRPGRSQDALITKAVSDMLQLELIERSSRHLQAISREIDKQIAAKGSPEAQRIQARREAAAHALTELQSKLKAIETEINAADSRKSIADGNLATLAEVADKSRRRAALDAELLGVEQRLESANLALMEACRDAMVEPASDVISIALTFLDEKRRKREIPGNYKDQFLRDLLKSRRCICDRSLDQGTPEYQHIEEILEITLPGSMQDNAVELAGQVRGLLKQLPVKKASLMRRLQDVEDTYRTRDEVENEIKQIGDHIGSSISEQVLKYENDRTQIDQDLLRLGIQANTTRIMIAAKHSEVDDLAKQFRKETEKEAALVQIRRVGDVASRSARSFASIRERLITELQGDLGEAGSKIFKQFTWKTAHFDRIRIGSDYLISVLDQFGNDVRDGMSMGETQILSLAFILSMIEISEYEAPLVIDTPLARLSVDVRHNLLSTLPQLTRQLVLLVTDSEMTGHARIALGDRVGAEYHLRFEDGVTTIHSGTPT